MNDDELIIVGALRIDLGSRRVFVDGEERTLTKKEFDLLVVLTSPPGRALSYDDLYKSVWHSLAPHDYRKTRCISSLMARLRPNIAPERIDSLHGFGFRYRVELRPCADPADPA
jgi:DNA-binding response OmpR family regulator